MHTDKPERALDVDVALTHVGGDTELLSELASMFVQDYPRLIEEAGEAILKRDHAVLERSAHTLRGRLAFFGVSRLRDRLAELEKMGREQDLGQALPTLVDIKAEMNSILLEFEPLILEKG
jgi:two-component system, sensor histidine kinase and response regulator